MTRSGLVRTPALALAALTLTALSMAGCSAPSLGTGSPELAPRGTTMTTATLTRQDLTSKVSLDGEVTLNPVFGLVAPIAGQVRYYDVDEPTGTPSRPTRAANIWADGRPTLVEVPAGATFAGRLVDDRSTVVAGMPIVSAKHVGYGIVAEIDGEQAYQLSDALTSVRAQIKNGPGPFDCAVLGTIAALPAGTIPAPPAPDPPADDPGSDDAGSEDAGEAAQPPPAPEPPDAGIEPSEPTGMRLVCVAPADVKLINGAAVTVEVVTSTVTQALVAPVEAVAGRQGAGKVDVLEVDGSRRTVDVVLGATDGRVVEIRSGLTGDETLAVPGPNLSEPPPDMGGPDGPGVAPTK